MNTLVPTCRREYLSFFILLGVLALFYAVTFLPGHDWGDDFALYIQHAHNLLSGIPYHDTHYLFNPEMPKIGPPAYPPGFPVLLLPVYSLFGLSWMAMKWWVTSFLLLALLTLYWMFAKQLTFASRLSLVALVGFNGVFVQVKEEIISDLPFLFFVLLTVGLLQRQSLSSAGKDLWVKAVLHALLIDVCYAIRLAGIVLVPALLWRDWLQHRSITQSTRLTLFLFCLLAFMQHLVFSGGGGYLTSLFLDFRLAQLPVKLFHNLNYFTLIWGDDKWVRILLFLLSVPPVFLALHRQWKKEVTIVETFCIGYFFLILLWPYTGVRFALPLFPFYFYYLLTTLQALPPIRFHNLVVSVSALFLGTAFFVYALHYQQRFQEGYWSVERDGVHHSYAQELFRFIGEETAQDAVILFNKPRILALMTGRSASAFSAQQPERLWEYIQKVQAGYLIDAFLEGGPPTPGLQSFIANNPDRLQAVFARGPVVVYRILSP
ncbi:hypothetical protein [Candidatus Magnetaquicoccus inordinatus]|uniref:hypothetical protein n=1 Tax=Candidatus Magnetaquicoccus inordinatus TaxID=2496818 RepID=UPI001290B1A3|nr:hypothetical protein [Candidatus Magnetaquicoccus inordinatus]